MNKFFRPTLLTLFSLAICFPNIWAQEKTDKERQNVVSGIGIVKKIDLEGGFFGIMGEDGNRYRASNLSEGFQKNGLQVSFKAKVRNDVFGIQMWGTPVEIIELHRVVSVVGHISKVKLGGGFFGIVGEKGDRFDPLNLRPEYQVENMPVCFRAKVRTDVMSMRMWGTIVEIIDINKYIKASGKVTKIDLEGGFFGIVTSEGGQYDPLNLSRKFQVDGLEVNFEAKVRDDVFGMRMWGTSIEIIDIRKPKKEIKKEEKTIEKTKEVKEGSSN